MDFANNNQVQISLRDECERLNLELNNVRSENKKLREDKNNSKEHESGSQVDQQVQIDRLNTLLKNTEQQVKD
jgi:hypothetical protein